MKRLYDIIIRTFAHLHICILALLICTSATAQYQQAMTYRDYSVHYQMRIGFPGQRYTDSSAFLELGTATNSKRGFLNARGSMLDVISPKKGLLFHDTIYNEPVWHDGVNWRSFRYMAGVGVIITGSGTPSDPWVINATGGASTDTNDLFARGNDTATVENMRFHGRGYSFEADSFSRYKTSVQRDSTHTGTVEIDTLGRTIISHQKIDTLTGDTSRAVLHIAEDSTSLLVNDSSGFQINEDSLFIKTKTGKVFIDTLPEGADADSLMVVWDPVSKRLSVKSIPEGGGPKDTLQHTITIPAPSGSENWTIFYTKKAITIHEVAEVVRGSSSPSATYYIAFGSNRGVESNFLFSASRTVSSTVGVTTATFADPTVPGGSFIVIKTTSITGTISELSVTLTFTND